MAQRFGQIFREQVKIVADIEAGRALADACARRLEVHERHIPEPLNRIAAGEQTEGEIVFFGLHEIIGGQEAAAGERRQGAIAQRRAGADEDIGVGGGFFGAIGQRDIKNRRA